MEIFYNTKQYKLCINQRRKGKIRNRKKKYKKYETTKTTITKSKSEKQLQGMHCYE